MIGYAITVAFLDEASPQDKDRISGALLVISAGTFLYAVTMHILPEVYVRKNDAHTKETVKSDANERYPKVLEMCALFVGILFPLLLKFIWWVLISHIIKKQICPVLNFNWKRDLKYEFEQYRRALHPHCLWLFFALRHRPFSLYLFINLRKWSQTNIRPISPIWAQNSRRRVIHTLGSRDYRDNKSEDSSGGRRSRFNSAKWARS